LGEAIKNSRKEEAKGTTNRLSYDAVNLDSPMKMHKLPSIKVSKMVPSVATSSLFLTDIGLSSSPKPQHPKTVASANRPYTLHLDN